MQGVWIAPRQMCEDQASASSLSAIAGRIVTALSTFSANGLTRLSNQYKMTVAVKGFVIFLQLYYPLCWVVLQFQTHLYRLRSERSLITCSVQWMNLLIRP